MLETDAKSRLLEEMLKHVPFEGWTDDSMRHAAQLAGISPVSLSMLFPKGVVDVVDFFILYSDQKMVEAILLLPLTEMKIRERIIAAIQIRLEQGLQHKNTIRRAMAYYALLHHAALAAHSVWRTADAIWYAIGDNSSDTSYYTERLTLSAVYSSTLLFWLDDFSDDHLESWKFLDRRIENVMQLGKMTSAFKKKLKW